MIAGRLKYKLELYAPHSTTDRMGEERIEYVLTRTVWAERVKLAGRRSNEVGEHFPDYDAQFNIRAEHAISEHWRVQQLGGHLYEVVAILPNFDRGFNTLVCQRVNE